MTAILSILAVIGTAAWYFRTAEQRGLPGLAWAVAGILVYYGGFSLWMYLVLRPLMGGGFQTHGFATGIGMDLTAILFGVLCMALFRARVLLRKPVPPAQP
jgi:hypothetical protein